MKRKNKVLLLLTFLLAYCTIVLYAIEIKAEAASAPKYYFINVSKYAGGKGSCTLIECNGKYYLVDGGAKGLYSSTKAKIKKITGKSKITLEAVIVTHYHSDHIGGIIKMILDTDTFFVKKIYKSKIVTANATSETYSKELDAAISTANKVHNKNNQETVPVNVSSKSHHNISMGNGCTLKIAGPSEKNVEVGKAKGLGSSVAVIENNLSMVVKIYTGDYNKNLIILGDLYEAGLRHAINEYSIKIDSNTGQPLTKNLFRGNVTYCVYGHHGSRSGTSYLQSETKLYNDYIKASTYITTLNKQDTDYKTTWYKYYEGAVKLLGNSNCTINVDGDWIVK